MRVQVRFYCLLALLILFLSHQTFPQTNIQTKQEIYPQVNPPVFENITIKDGLPENSVTCILQDYLGYLWFGTQNGLAKYDGYSMKVFLPEEDNSRSISNGGIVTIYEDKNKILWIGTLNGLNKFDRTNETFKSYKYNSIDTGSINGNHIECIYEDIKGRFWVSTTEGLNLFDIDNEIFTRYYLGNGDSDLRNISRSDQNNLSINAIIEDPVSGDLFIGTEMEGLWSFNIKEKIFSKYRCNTDINHDKKIGCIQSFYKAMDGKIWMASNNTISSLDATKREFKFYLEFPIMANQRYTQGFHYGSVIEDKQGIIWSGFFAGEMGVFCLNQTTGSFLQYYLFPEAPKNANYNDVNTLYEDCSGILWIGTWGSGLMKLDKGKNKFQILRGDPKNLSNSLSNSSVYSVTYDSNGFIWYSTRTALDKYDIKTGAFKHYFKNEKCITKSVYTTIQDKAGHLWLGTGSCGLIRFDPIEESYRFYFNNKNESINLTNKRITRLLQDQFGLLWIGTEGFGLYKYDITNNKLTNYKNDPNDSSSLSHNVVRALFEDRSGNLWIGTSLGGLNKFDRKTEKFSFVGLNSVLVIYEDKQENLWLSDYFLGLTLFDREKGAVIASYNKKDGLAYNYIMGILEDDQKNLWINTEIGLSKFNTKTRTFRNYYKKDGLPDWFPTESKLSKGLDGRIYFNTTEGLIVFHPDSIKEDPIPPLVVLSDVSLFNRSDEKLNYKGFISELKDITLPYDQNDLRFDYVGLHFSEPTSNKYKYILENFDNGWVNAGTQRNATYTNLSPGEYIFRVTASNKDGVWNETGASIRIIILPPWWKTTWAYIIYVIILGSILYFTWKLQLKRIRTKQEFEMSKFEAQKLHEVDELKTRFFTNISHEFRTPLTLIQGPAKQIIENTNESQTKDRANFIYRNSLKLITLVNQLLDLTKLEAGEATIRATKTDVVAFIKEIVLSFTPLTERKKIKLEFNHSKDQILAYLDRDKFYKIISNILSNAFKFTAEQGKINIVVDENNSMVEIKISDTGIGIPPEKTDKIFNRFYQVDSSHTRDQEGTGIGLALTKELVDLHKGKINVQSKEGEGSTFTISIPLGKDHFKPEQISEIGEVEYRIPDFQEDVPTLDTALQNKFDTDSLAQEQKPTILVVEDNPDVRLFIKGILENDYKIYEAGNGEEGTKVSFAEIPDLIISDLMMPKMDGIEMCSKLKSDERTSHIPIIMLTAKATDREKIEGYETGADDYIIKPFNEQVLRARVKNLIEQRKKLKERFAKDGLFSLDDKNLTSVDKTFLKKIIQIVNNHISDTSFGVDTFASEIALSRVTLHKKLVSLIGEPPSELIKRIRLSKAAKLLQGNQENISEIALDVGFSNPAYFSECFRKQFGLTPSQYQQKFNIY